MNRAIDVLSLFDGMGSAWIALKELGIPVGRGYSSEVDKFAIRQVKMNFPDVEHLGDIRSIQGASLGHIDLIMGGSACQNLSFAGNRAGLSTKEGIEVLSLEQYMELKEAGFEFEGQSYLFWEYVRLRVFTPTEYARLQTVPAWYSWEGTSSTQIRKMCGNGWTIEVIKHILSYLKEKTMVNLEELEEKLDESLENETSESLTEFVEARGIAVKELEEAFEGRGEVNGFTFTQLHRTEYAYMYEQKEEISGHITYEVFRRRINAQFGCVSYPKSNGFGDSAYMGKTFRSLDKAMAYFEYLNDYCRKKSLEVA